MERILTQDAFTNNVLRKWIGGQIDPGIFQPRNMLQLTYLGATRSILDESYDDFAYT